MSKNLTTDLPDSERDKEELKQEETTIDLPDVKDIPGQENIHVQTVLVRTHAGRAYSSLGCGHSHFGRIPNTGPRHRWLRCSPT